MYDYLIIYYISYDIIYIGTVIAIDKNVTSKFHQISGNHHGNHPQY